MNRLLGSLLLLSFCQTTYADNGASRGDQRVNLYIKEAAVRSQGERQNIPDPDYVESIEDTAQSPQSDPALNAPYDYRLPGMRSLRPEGFSEQIYPQVNTRNSKFIDPERIITSAVAENQETAINQYRSHDADRAAALWRVELELKRQGISRKGVEINEGPGSASESAR